ncbi:hypothetical protein N7540_008182 [Penicillium herquei]|nr:hypothetical protein N7540_008182 [Penicillium herquei]
MTQTKTWSSIFFVLGAIAQLSGYVARIFSTQNVCNRGAYGVQSVLLLLGPTLIMVSVNMTQAKFARALHAEKLCFIPIDWQPWLYMSINIILAILQVIGGIMTVAPTSITTIAAGDKMTIAIYVIQTVFWGLVFSDNICMTIRLRRQPTDSSKKSLANWKLWNQLFGLSTSIIAVGRNVMRLTMAGGVAFLIESEWPSYVFDGYQMVVVLTAWAIWYLPEKCEAIPEGRDYRSLTGLEDIRSTSV